MGWQDDPVKASKPAWQSDPIKGSEPEVSRLGALGHGIRAGGSFGLDDEIGAGVQALMQAVTGGTTDANGKPMSAGDVYRQARSENRSQEQSIRDARPGYYMGGEVLGGLAVPVGGAVAGGLKGAVKAGTLYGMGAGLGNSQADLTKGDVGGAINDMTVGGILGGAGGAVGQGAAKAVPSVLKKAMAAMDRYAGGRAIKAAGGQKSTVKNLVKTGRLNDAARDLYDQGIVTPLASLDEIGERVGTRLSAEGSEIGRILKGLDQGGGQGFSATAAADRLERELLSELQASPAMKGYAPGVAEKIQSVRELGTVPFERANKVKSEFASAANWNSDQVPQELKQRLVGILNSEIEGQIASSATPTALAPFREAKRLYGTLSEVRKISEGAKAGQAGNQMFSPFDKGSALAAGGGLLANGGLEASVPAVASAVAAGLAAKLLRERGSQFTGALTHRAARGIERLLKREPGLAADLAKRAGSRGGAFSADDLTEWLRSLSPQVQAQLAAAIDSEPVPVTLRSPGQ